MVDGVKYDHVLAIEIEQPTGLQKLQIGHNDGDNPCVNTLRLSSLPLFASCERVFACVKWRCSYSMVFGLFFIRFFFSLLLQVHHGLPVHRQAWFEPRRPRENRQFHYSKRGGGWTYSRQWWQQCSSIGFFFFFFLLCNQAQATRTGGLCALR